jgi:hypothetical protein
MVRQGCPPRALCRLQAPRTSDHREAAQDAACGVFEDLRFSWSPREFKVEQTTGIKGLTNEELEQMLAMLRETVDAKPGEAAKVIEGEAEVVPSLPTLATPTKAS